MSARGRPGEGDRRTMPPRRVGRLGWPWRGSNRGVPGKHATYLDAHALEALGHLVHGPCAVVATHLVQHAVVEGQDVELDGTDAPPREACSLGPRQEIGAHTWRRRSPMASSRASAGAGPPKKRTSSCAPGGALSSQ